MLGEMWVSEAFECFWAVIPFVAAQQQHLPLGQLLQRTHLHIQTATSTITTSALKPP